MQEKIKDDAISRQAALYAIYGICNEPVAWLIRAASEIEKLPPAQPDIIACGDCKHWICHDKRCGYWNHGVKPLDWCSYAERRNE